MTRDDARLDRPEDSPIDAVLFDFTGVITNSPFVGLAELEEETGALPGSIVRLVMGDYDQDTDHPWHRLERGEIAAAEYYASLVQLAGTEGIELDFGAVFGRLGDLSVRPEVVERIREIHDRGWKTALVTNNIREFGDAWRALFPVDEIFDAVIDSCRLGIRKPDRAIYLQALAELGGVRPDRAIFVDDLESNVLAARAAGLRGLLFTLPTDTLRILEEQLCGITDDREAGDPEAGDPEAGDPDAAARLEPQAEAVELAEAAPPEAAPQLAAPAQVTPAQGTGPPATDGDGDDDEQAAPAWS